MKIFDKTVSTKKKLLAVRSELFYSTDQYLELSETSAMELFRENS